MAVPPIEGSQLRLIFRRENPSNAHTQNLGADSKTILGEKYHIGIGSLMQIIFIKLKIGFFRARSLFRLNIGSIPVQFQFNCGLICEIRG